MTGPGSARIPAFSEPRPRTNFHTAELEGVSERLGHATIAITMDTYSHVLPGLDVQAAGTVARLILGDREEEPARPVDKALTTDRPTPSRRKGGEARTTWSEGCASGGIRTPTGCPTGT